MTHGGPESAQWGYVHHRGDPAPASFVSVAGRLE